MPAPAHRRPRSRVVASPQVTRPRSALPRLIRFLGRGRSTFGKQRGIAMVLFVWLIIAAVVLGVGTLLGFVDRRARRQGHGIRRASTMAAIAFSRRSNLRRPRPGGRATAPRTRSKY